VRLVGADLLAHPQSALLIYDAVRLFRHVEVAGEASAIVDWNELDLRRLKDLKRIDVALYGPDPASHDAHCGIPGAFAATLRGIERLREKTQVVVGAYAILHDAASAPAFAEAWSRGLLPGEPRFRLSPKGASLGDLLECVRGLPDGPARSALLALLPACLTEPQGFAIDRAALGFPVKFDELPQTLHCGQLMPYHPCGSDPIGIFVACDAAAEACGVADCVGIATGWQSIARSNRWMASR
jgi:hypothetical protein